MTITEAKKHLQDAEGFTLVELAVVMIIIGLLIGGVLQGQQLIENARVTNVVSTIKAYEVAQTTFLDSYNGVPGDLVGPGARLPNCSGLCDTDGNGNNQVDGFPGVDPAGEQRTYFLHLAAAGMVEGVDTTIAAESAVFGESYPANPLGGGFHVGRHTGVGSAFTAANFGPGTIVVGPPANPTNNPSRGTYLTMVDTAGAVAAGSLTPGIAARMDIKLDDGVPALGNVRSFGSTAATVCTNVNDDITAVYASANDGIECGIVVRIQG